MAQKLISSTLPGKVVYSDSARVTIGASRVSETNVKCDAHM